MSSVLAVDMSCWLVFPSPIDGWLGDCRLPKNSIHYSKSGSFQAVIKIWTTDPAVLIYKQGKKH